MSIRNWIADHSWFLLPALLLAVFAALVIPAIVYGNNLQQECEAADGVKVRGTCIDEDHVIDLDH